MATTTKEIITGEWKQISEGDCTMQSLKKGIIYNVSISAEPPSASSISLLLDEPTTFAYKTPVWVKIEAKGSVGMQQAVNIIK